MNEYEKVLFIPDIHCPFQDNRALEVLYSFMDWYKPDTIFIMGDVLDCYAISRFTKDPNGELKFQEELDEATNILRKIRHKAKKAKIYLLRGNHELRVQKFLWTNAKALSGLHALEVESLLGLHKLDIEYIREGSLRYHGLMIKHGNIVRKFSGYTAKGEFEDNGCSGVSGHSHRLSIYRQTNSGGEYIWVEAGHLCNPKQEYLEGKVANWQQGWALGWFKKNSKRYHLETVNLVNYKAFYGGKEFE